MPSGKLVLLSPEGTVVKEDVPTVKTAQKLAADHALKAGKSGVYKVMTVKTEIDTNAAAVKAPEQKAEAKPEVKPEAKKVEKKEKYFT